MASKLTRHEAHDRARLIDVRGYRVDLDLTGDDKVFKSLTTVTFGCSRPGAGPFIDLAAESVTEIMLNGRPVAHRDEFQNLLLSISAGEEAKVTLQRGEKALDLVVKLSATSRPSFIASTKYCFPPAR